MTELYLLIIKVMKEKRAKLPLELRKVFLFSLVSLAHGMKGLCQETCLFHESCASF